MPPEALSYLPRKKTTLKSGQGKNGVTFTVGIEIRLARDVLAVPHETQRVDGSAQSDDDLGKWDLVHGSQADLSLDLDLPLEDDREVTEEAVEDEGEELDPDDSLDPMLGTRQNVSSLVG